VAGAFGVWRLAFGVWRSAFGVQRSAGGLAPRASKKAFATRDAVGLRSRATGARTSKRPPHGT
jgi:hypothetical protein